MRLRHNKVTYGTKNMLAGIYREQDYLDIEKPIKRFENGQANKVFSVNSLGLVIFEKSHESV